jgi:hypothetical protein
MPSLQYYKKITALLFTYIAIFLTIYHYTYTNAHMEFEIEKIKASHGHAYGQLYYSSSTAYSQNNMSPFLHWWGYQKKFQSFTLPIKIKTLNSLRFDPLSNIGEVIVKNMSIIRYHGFRKKVLSIDLTKVNTNTLHNIEIIDKTKNSLHIKATGKDPHVEIANNMQLRLSRTDNFEIIKISFYSFLVFILFYYTYIGFKRNYLKGEEILIATLLLAYSGYTVLFGTQFKMAYLLLTSFPFISLLIVIKQGIFNYMKYLRNALFILIYLSLITLMNDYVYEKNSFKYLMMNLPLIIYAILLSMTFIQKKSFNFHFYKYFLFTLTTFIAILTILLHYYIIRIDTNLLFGFTMSMSEWAQKNYTFWYIFLMWGTISFFHLRTVNVRDKIAISFILILSSISIFSGYPDSAKLAFVFSTFIYGLISYTKPSEKILISIPIIISLYILLFPWIAEYYTLLSAIHVKVSLREGLFVIYSDIIRNNVLLGYGFNNTGSIVPVKCVSPEVLKHYADNLFMQNCNPHSVPLLWWLNLGLVGMLPFSIFVFISIKNLIKLTLHKNNQAALIALISSFIVIITFSWGTWASHSLLTFSFFMGMIFLSLNINKQNT